MQALGDLPISANIRDIRWVTHFLEANKMVQKDRIGCVGLSYGGLFRYFVLLIENHA